MLKLSGVDVPDHAPNVIALYASTAAERRQRVHRNLRALIEQTGNRGTARRLGVDRETIRDWLHRPDRMLLYRVVPVLLSPGVVVGARRRDTKGGHVCGVPPTNGSNLQPTD
jgi:hypothetical protein